MAYGLLAPQEPINVKPGWLDNPNTIGLLSAGLGILANNTGNYGQFGPAVGKGGLLGLQAYGNAQQSSLFARRQADDENFRKFQMDDITAQRKAERDRAQAEADARARLFGFMAPQPVQAQQGVQQRIDPSSGALVRPMVPDQPMNVRPLGPNDMTAPEVGVQARPMEDPAVFRSMAMQAAAAGLPQEATFLNGLATRLEDQQNKEIERNERTFTDNQGIVRYFNTGEPVAKQTPRTPEGFTYADGKFVPIPEYWEQKGRVAERGADKTVIKTGESVAKEIGPMLTESRNAAMGAVQTVHTVDRIKSAIESGNVTLGPTATVRNSARQFAQILGLSDKGSQENLVNTRTVMRGLAQFVIAARKGLKGQGQVSDNEQKLLERAESGNIDDFTLPELRSFIDVTERLARQQYDEHQQSLKNMEGMAETKKLVPFYRVPEMPAPRSSMPTQQNKTRKPMIPKGYTVEKVEE